MSNKLFPPELLESLRRNPNVKNATEKAIQFSDDFKRLAVEDYLDGKPRRQIFEEGGFDVDAIGADRVANAFGNWLTKHKRGKDVASEKRGRRSARGLTVEERLARAEAENALLRHENEFLRQIRRLERRHQPSKSPSEKYTKR